MLGSDDRFDTTIHGRGGHTIGPHKTIDALVIAADLVGQLQTLVCRRVDPLVPAALSVGSLHSGDVYNVILATATLSGTVRTLSPEVRDLFAEELIALATEFAAAHGATADVGYFSGSPPLINHEMAVRFARPGAVVAVDERGIGSLAATPRGRTLPTTASASLSPLRYLAPQQVAATPFTNHASTSTKPWQSDCDIFLDLVSRWPDKLGSQP